MKLFIIGTIIVASGLWLQFKSPSLSRESVTDVPDTTYSHRDPKLPVTVQPSDQVIKSVRGTNVFAKPLWVAEMTAVDKDGLIVYPVTMDVSAASNLQTGDTLTLPVPVYEQNLLVTLTETRNSLNQTEVWRGDVAFTRPIEIDGVLYAGHETDQVLITRGEWQTHIAVLTRQGNISAVIDNETGKGQLVDERQYQPFEHGEDAVMMPEPHDHDHSG